VPTGPDGVCRSEPEIPAVGSAGVAVACPPEAPKLTAHTEHT
jgi:hypothetical protein